MKKLVYIIALGIAMVSCQKEVITPNDPPLPPQPIITDSTGIDSTLNLVGQTWVITKILYTSYDQELRSDTIKFITNTTYKFNVHTSTYSFYSTTNNYKLNMNNTPWGHISGSMFDYNLSQGVLDNCTFVVYFSGVYRCGIWMHRI
jgi:hypothetical protein